MKLPVAYLRAILRAHNVLEDGTKEELITRVGLVKAGYPEAAFSRERLCILHMIAVAKQIVHIQENSKASSICRTRTFAHGKTNTMWTRDMEKYPYKRNTHHPSQYFQARPWRNFDIS